MTQAPLRDQGFSVVALNRRLNHSPSISSRKTTSGDVTRQQIKHDMLIAFMANVKSPKQIRRPAPKKTKLLKTLLSIFF